MIVKKTYPAFVLILFCIILFSCSKSKTGDTTNPPPVNNGKTVNIASFKFDPGTITVAKGTIVTFVNSDAAPHTATADDGSFDTGSISQGGSAKITFNTAGTFTYFCIFHPAMTASITVTP